MKYDRAALVAAAQTGIDRHKRHFDKVTLEARQNEEKNRAKWLAMYADPWASSARAILRKLRKGEPVTVDDLPRKVEWQSDIATYRPLKDANGEWSPPAVFVDAKSVLEAVVGDVVTTRQLDELGITHQTLRHITPYLTAGTVSA